MSEKDVLIRVFQLTPIEPTISPYACPACGHWHVGKGVCEFHDYEKRSSYMSTQRSYINKIGLHKTATGVDYE